jgi:hypothetical protein
VNRVVLTGRLTRDPESRKLASGKTVTHVLQEYHLIDYGRGALAPHRTRRRCGRGLRHLDQPRP